MNPFIDSAYETALCTTDEESELILIDIKNDCRLTMQYSKLVKDAETELKLKKIKINVDIPSLWIHLYKMNIRFQGKLCMLYCHFQHLIFVKQHSHQ